MITELDPQPIQSTIRYVRGTADGQPSCVLFQASYALALRSHDQFPGLISHPPPPSYPLINHFLTNINCFPLVWVILNHFASVLLSALVKTFSVSLWVGSVKRGRGGVVGVGPFYFSPLLPYQCTIPLKGFFLVSINGSQAEGGGGELGTLLPRTLLWTLNIDFKESNHIKPPFTNGNIKTNTQTNVKISRYINYARNYK